MKTRKDDILRNEGLVRTDMHCHACSEKGLPPSFIARIDYGLNGNHEIECPRCGHLHYRKIVDGVITDDRYHSDNHTHRVGGNNVWKSETVPIETSTAQMFLRDLWLKRESD